MKGGSLSQCDMETVLTNDPRTRVLSNTRLIDYGNSIKSCTDISVPENPQKYLGLKSYENSFRTMTGFEQNAFDQQRGSKSSKHSKRSFNLRYADIDQIEKQRDHDLQVLERSRRLNQLVSR